MSLSLACPSCNRTLKAPRSAAGRRLTCPGCRERITVPAPQPAPDADPFDFQANGQEKPERAKAKRGGGMTIEKLAALTFLLLVLAGFLGGFGYCGYRFVYVPTVLKPRQRQQARLYEEFLSAEEALRNAKGAREVAEQQKRLDQVLATCKDRYGAHPRAFADLPYSSNRYYDE